VSAFRFRTRVSLPALWKRSRRGLFHTAAVICAIAVVASGVAAVTIGPARAQTITSGGPYALSNPGGDLVSSFDVADVAPASESNFITTTWPESVGLSSGESLSALFQSTWKQYSSTWDAYSSDAAAEFPEPPSFNGGTVSVASDGAGGSTVTIDIPAADVTANAGVPSWLQGVLAGIAGFAGAAVAWGACQATVFALAGPLLLTTGPAGPALTAVGSALCGGLATGAWTFAASVANQAFSGQPFTSDVWAHIWGQTLGSIPVGAVLGPAGPIVRRVMQQIFSGLSNAITAIFNFIEPYVVSGWTNLLAAIKRFFTRGQTQVDNALDDIELGAGIPTPSSTGSFHTAPGTPTGPGVPVGASCMDAYGAAGGASPGQIVAVNSCNGNDSQEWDYYQNGQVAVYGLCLDTGGGTSSLGTPLVNLEACDGATSQEWTPSGSTLVNKATSECLDDPNGNTAPGTQLAVYTCNGSAAQQWLAPTAEPCDIYAFYGTSCVAAYSMTRALYADYDGPLYRVQRASDGTTAEIGPLNAGGDVDAAAQDSFCSGTTCTITEIYDQSPMGNNLAIEGPGGNGGQDQGADATALPIKIDGNEAYGLDIEPGIGYRADTTDGVATDGEPEGVYMVASGTHVNDGCCFDFGNAEANNDDNNAGHMDAVNLSTTCYFAPCSGSGPWVQADLENGLFMGSGPNTANLGNSSPFVTAMLQNNGKSTFALEGGDATSGALSTWYSGPLPSGYAPMHQEGSVVLGTGGDDSNTAVGSWFEGVMTAGEPGQAAGNAVQANITAAGYSGNTNPGSGSNGPAPSAAGAAVVHSAGATGAAASGYSSVYTVDSANGDLQESYLPYLGDSWSTQDLTAKYGTPAVMPGTEPVALVHCGYTSVYTVDASDGDLQETYLSNIGNSWATHDLTALAGTPPTDETPTAVVHDAGATGKAAACGFTSVYSVDRDGDLQETYLPDIGGSWVTQDLTVNYLAPLVEVGTSPVAIVHCGYTSVYTVDADHQLQETYLAAIGDRWITQSLSALSGTPDTTTTPTAVVHDAGATGTAAACGFTSVYTVDAANRDLQETYLPVIGGSWVTQDLSANYSTPEVAPGTAPVALVHTGYTSVYTVDKGSDDLQETYLSNIGNSWATHDLTTLAHTPTTVETPIVLLHPNAAGALTWTSVYTFDEFSDDLQETYLSAIGGSWATQSLSANYHTPEVAGADFPTAGSSLAHAGYTSVYTVDATTGDLQETYLSNIGNTWATHTLPAPPVLSGTQPVAVTHDGYTSVYTVDKGSDDLQETYLSNVGNSWATHDLTTLAHTPTTEQTPTAVFHDGYTSVYTVDASNDDLQETYLAAIGGSWVTQDLTANYSAPAVAPYSYPVAVFSEGRTSVFTVDGTNGHLQDTYLPTLGGPWVTQDLTATAGTPLVENNTSPSAIVHTGFTSVYTVDNSNGHLQETFLPAVGDPWVTQDLTANYGAPTVDSGASPVALFHTGYTSVYTMDANGDLQETYLGAIGDSWATHDLSAEPGGPPALMRDPAPLDPSPLLHYDANGGLTWTSVYSVDSSSGDLQETYLPAIGDSWATQNLTATAGTPEVAPV
jgi:hypothetical protein